MVQQEERQTRYAIMRVDPGYMSIQYFGGVNLLMREIDKLDRIGAHYDVFRVIGHDNEWTIEEEKS